MKPVSQGHELKQFCVVTGKYEVELKASAVGFWKQGT